MGATAVDEDLEVEFSRAAGQLNASHARLVEITARVIACDEWRGYGIRSVEHWLTLHGGVKHSVATAIARVARRWDEFPETMALFTAGGLSLDQVEVIALRAPGWADHQMAGFAPEATVSQLRKVIRAEFFEGPDVPATPAPADDDSEQSEPEPVGACDGFRYGWDEHGRFVGSFDLAADRGKVAEALFDAIRDDLFRATNRVPEPGVVLCEAIARASRHPNDVNLVDSWGNGSRPGDSLGRFRTFVHLELPNNATIAASWSNGERLPDTLATYLTCDGTVTPVWCHDHVAVGYGRQQRIVPLPLRRLVEHRDQGCVVPGCGSRFVEIHHIIHWSHDGVTETWNLVSLCPAHHRMHHHGRLSITGNPDTGTLTITDPHGQPLPRPSPIPPDRPAPPVKPYDRPSGGTLQLRYFAGWNHPDLHNTPPDQRNWN